MLIEVPHFASLRGNEREITILRSDNGQTWREHSTVATEEAVQEALEGSFSGQLISCIAVILSYEHYTYCFFSHVFYGQFMYFYFDLWIIVRHLFYN